MQSCILKSIKKLDAYEDVKVDGLILDVYELVPDSNVRSITVKDCIIKHGLLIKGVEAGASLFIENCTFESYNGITIEECCFNAVYIKNSKLVAAPDGEIHYKFMSGIVSNALVILNSNIQSIFVIDVNISIEVSNSSFGAKMHYFPSKLDGDERSYAFFENVIFESTQVRLAGAELKEIKFININTDLKQESKCHSLEIKQDFVLELIFQNANFVDTYIDLENVVIRNIEARSSILGKVFNFYIGNIKEETERKVNAISVKNCILGKSYFHGRIIHNSVDFCQTRFNDPPEFYNAEIPHGSIFPDSSYFNVSGTDSSISAFRALRLHMEEQRNRELEGEFFYLEQKSILKKEKDSGNINIFRYFYGVISDFGTNAVRPLIIVVLAGLFFSLVYALWLSPKVSIVLPLDFELLSRSLHFSVKQITQPFWSLRDLAPLMDKEVKTHPIVYIAILQSFISLTCVTLTVLAIRWRFKRG
jgi:hypothetical protein